MPYYFAADDAFPLKVRIIKPFPGRQLKESFRIFNYRLCRGRRVVENAFGILCVPWQIFYKTLNCDPETAQLLVQACVVLDNFLMSQSSSTSGYVIGDKTDASTFRIINGNLRLLTPASLNLSRFPRFGSNFLVEMLDFVETK